MSTPAAQLRFRQRNRTYYDDLARLHRLLVGENLRVLEIGCGLGDLLASVKPAHGVGSSAIPRWRQRRSSATPGCASSAPTLKRSARLRSARASPSM